MKRLIFLMLAAMLLCSSAWAATKAQVMTDGKIDVDKLPTIDFSLSEDPASPETGRVWWNETTKQIKVADVLGIYEFNATSLVAWDTTPDAFSFIDVVNATTSTLYTSAPITVAGINHPAPISVSGDASAKYSVNNATATAANGTVASGDEVRAVVTSSASDATSTNATVTIGGVSDAYVVTTAVESVDPPPVENATYLINEDFEGTGTPSGWTLSLSSADYATSPLNGAQSLSTGNGVTYGSATSPTFSSIENGYAHFMYRQSELSTSSQDIMRLQSGTNQAAKIQVTSGGGLKALYGTTSDTGDAGTIVPGEIYNIWVYFEGSSGAIAVYISENSTRPDIPEVSVVGGNSGYATIDNVQFRNCQPAYSYFDDIKISADGW